MRNTSAGINGCKRLLFKKRDKVMAKANCVCLFHGILFSNPIVEDKSGEDKRGALMELNKGSGGNGVGRLLCP